MPTDPMTKRKRHRIRGQMAAQQPAWRRHLWAIADGSSEIQKAIDTRTIDLATATDIEGATPAASAASTAS